MREPAFWWRPAGLAAGLLSPLGLIQGAVTARRMAQPGEPAGIPVICIGNLTVGGAGKTPTAILVAQMLVAAGRRPFLLSRGYGGREAGPIQVDLARHRARDVGDEPLLLARAAPTIVSHDRVAGAAHARMAGADVIVMDDGFQNPGLAKDLSIIVVDGRRGIGNAMAVPAGPLRAPFKRQLDRAQAVLVVGEGTAADPIVVAARERALAIFRGRLELDPEAVSKLKGRPVLAFAGIGDPEKFYATLREAGLDIRAQRSFPDHHRYRGAEATDLIRRCERDGLVPVTTEKDWVRLAWQDDLVALAGIAHALPVRLVVSGENVLRDYVLSRIGARPTSRGPDGPAA
jgi:tetraacyldisaccharide 4'-kinase